MRNHVKYEEVSQLGLVLGWKKLESFFSFSFSFCCVWMVRIMTETWKIMQEHILNSRGLKLFTCRWFPANQDPKALIFILHGYAMECSISMNGMASTPLNFKFSFSPWEGKGKGKFESYGDYWIGFRYWNEAGKGRICSLRDWLWRPWKIIWAWWPHFLLWWYS